MKTVSTKQSLDREDFTALEALTRSQFTLPDEMPKLSEEQGRALRGLYVYFIENRFFPTVRELAAACSISKTATVRILARLEQFGYVARAGRGQSRNIRISDKGLRKLQHDELQRSGRRI